MSWFKNLFKSKKRKAEEDKLKQLQELVLLQQKAKAEKAKKAKIVLKDKATPATAPKAKATPKKTTTKKTK